jgi:hypothetical protein
VLLTATPPEQRIDESELLFREARQRRRRRWLVAGIVMAIVAAVVIVTVTLSGTKPPVAPSASPPPTAPARPITSATAPPHVAWADYNGMLHVGDLSGFSQRAVAQADADPTAPLVTAGGRVIWVRSQYPNPNGSFTTSASPDVFAYDTATGKTEWIASGTQVMASVDRTFVYVETDSRHLSEYWLNGTPRGRTLRFPTGWFLLKSGLNSDPSPVVANGILVVSTPYSHSSIQPNDGTLAIWDPTNGDVRALGEAWQLSATYTAPGARSSLVAWYPASCGASHSCTLQITNTADYSSRLVASPGGHFLWGGGFSPDGSQLAVFANSADIHGDPTAQLALVNTQSGALRLVRGVYVYVGDSVHWADWLPDGRHLITGHLGGGFGSSAPAVDALVDSQTLQVSPFRFIADQNQDLTLSTVVVN